MNHDPHYTAKAIVNAFLYALLGLLIPIALLAFSCLFFLLWLALGLPG